MTITGMVWTGAIVETSDGENVNTAVNCQIIVAKIM